jgi:hypothetical protein
VIEAAIRQRQKLLIAQPGMPRGPAGALTIWPLQQLLLGGRWWLLHEHATYGSQEGLLACTPLEVLHVFQVEKSSCRDLAAHAQALERAEVLQEICGGLCFGQDLAQQLELVRADPQQRQRQLTTLRLRCAPAAMAELRRELDRFHPSAIRLAAPLPGDSWGGVPARRYSLQADDDPHHPYPVEIDLPAWVLERDPELRRWLLSLGSGIRLEAPQALVAELRGMLAQALALYAPPPANAGCREEAQPTADAGERCEPAPGVRPIGCPGAQVPRGKGSRRR